MIYLLGQFWSALMRVISRYPAVLDGIRLAVAGLFLESWRRGLDKFVGAIMRGTSLVSVLHGAQPVIRLRTQASTLTILVDCSDDVYTWLLDWAIDNTGLSTVFDNTDPDDKDQQATKHTRHHFLLDLIEQLFPTGRTHPRTLEIGVADRAPTPWGWFFFDEEPTEGIIEAPVLVRLAKGVSYAIGRVSG